MNLLGKTFGAMAMASVAALALAQGPGPWGGGPGYGPGMMGYGYGPGMMGRGPGPYGGPGMMGWGGPGMMGGGGPGMMFGYEMKGALGLSDDQRKKIDAIHDDLQAKNWDIMGKMRLEMVKMRELMSADPLDKAAVDAAYKRMNDLRQQRFDAQLAARQQMEVVLSKEQRDRLKSFGPWWLGQAE